MDFQLTEEQEMNPQDGAGIRRLKREGLATHSACQM